MFRTRDFVLIFTTVVFLVVAIGATFISGNATQNSETDSPFLPTNEFTSDFKTEVSAAREPDRNERLASLRKKISESAELFFAEPETPDPETTQTVPEEPMAIACPIPLPTDFAWPSGTVEFEVVEGARLVYQENLVTRSSSTGSTTVITEERERNILAQLPVKNLPAGNPVCPDSDIIGVALDGSLIRNNEAGLYGVFGSETLIGYALDGFPIYGVGTSLSDECGGIVVGGMYRYELAVDRNSILNCFSGQPVSL